MSVVLNPFGEEHQMLRDSFRRFIEKEITPNVERWEKNKECPRHIFEKMGEHGFFGVSFPTEVGGSGMDLWSAVVIAEELAYANIGGLGMSLYAHTYLPLPLINALGTEEQKRKYLTPALKGEKIAALGLTEPGAGSDLSGISTTAVDNGDHYVVNGSKMYITNGTIADFVVALVRHGEGYNMSFLIIDTNTPGFSANKMDWKLGMHTSDTGHLFFDNCIVPKANLIGQQGMGFYYAMNNLQEERLIGAVTAAFAAEAALEKAKRYAKEREAFGRPIAKFQVIRHKIAQMAIKAEACKAFAFRAVQEFIERGAEAVKIISMAKAFTSEVAMEVVDAALQIHGGAGYMEEYGIARSWRDMRLLTIGAGTTEIMHEVISKLVMDEVQHRNIVIKARKGETVAAD
ncbi:MAG: acyl-CoA dehydrogenase family protein [Bacteroidia bacterium]|nr:acyl-CoA dehydrogenase family protein [Bacteroidia bacterium]